MGIVLVALRKFWLLLVVSVLAGAGLGVVTGTVLQEPPAQTLWEARIDSVVLTQDEAKLLGSRYIRDSSFSAEARWFFPSTADGSPRARTVGTLLLLESTGQEMAETLALSLSELKERASVVEEGTPQILNVKVWGTTREHAEQLVRTITSNVEGINTQYFPTDPPPLFMDVTYQAPTLSTQLNLDELLEWRRSVLPALELQQDPVLSELESLRRDATDLYLSETEPSSQDLSSDPNARAAVTITAQPLNRLEALVRHSQKESVVSALDDVVAALETAGQLESPYRETSAVVVVSVGVAYQVQAVARVDRSIVLVVFGALFGLLLSGMFVMISLSPRRVLWSPTQLHEIADSVPIAVVPARGANKDVAGVEATNSGVSALRTNLFFSSMDIQVVAFTSPTSEPEYMSIATDLAKSLVQVGRRAAVVHAGVRAPHPAPSELLGAGRSETSGPLDSLPPILTHPTTDADGFDVVGLRPEFQGSLGLFLSSKWGQALAWLSQNYDSVLVVLDPVREKGGVIEAAKACDLTVVVIRPGTTRPQDLAFVISQLAQAGAPAPEIAVVGVQNDDAPGWYLPVQA